MTGERSRSSPALLLKRVVIGATTTPCCMIGWRTEHWCERRDRSWLLLPLQLPLRLPRALAAPTFEIPADDTHVCYDHASTPCNIHTALFLCLMVFMDPIRDSAACAYTVTLPSK